MRVKEYQEIPAEPEGYWTVGERVLRWRAADGKEPVDRTIRLLLGCFCWNWTDGGGDGDRTPPAMEGWKVEVPEAGERCNGIWTNDALRDAEPRSSLPEEREGDVWRLPPPPLKPAVVGDWTHLRIAKNLEPKLTHGKRKTLKESERLQNRLAQARTHSRHYLWGLVCLSARPVLSPLGPKPPSESAKIGRGYKTRLLEGKQVVGNRNTQT